MGDRGCIRIGSRSVCAVGKGEKVGSSGTLEAGFPPTNLPEQTYPLCEVEYYVQGSWTEARFDVDDWCLKGMKGERKCSAIGPFSLRVLSRRADSIEPQTSCAATGTRYTMETLFQVLITSRTKARPSHWADIEPRGTALFHKPSNRSKTLNPR